MGEPKVALCFGVDLQAQTTSASSAIMTVGQLLDRFIIRPLELQPQSKLKLPWIKRQRGLTKRRQRRHARTKRIVRYAVVGAIKKIESFDQRFERNALIEMKLTAQAHVERGVIKAATRIA